MFKSKVDSFQDKAHFGAYTPQHFDRSLSKAYAEAQMRTKKLERNIKSLLDVQRDLSRKYGKTLTDSYVEQFNQSFWSRVNPRSSLSRNSNMASTSSLTGSLWSRAASAPVSRPNSSSQTKSVNAEQSKGPVSQLKSAGSRGTPQRKMQTEQRPNNKVNREEMGWPSGSRQTGLGEVGVRWSDGVGHCASQSNFFSFPPENRQLLHPNTGPTSNVTQPKLNSTWSSSFLREVSHSECMSMKSAEQAANLSDKFYFPARVRQIVHNNTQLLHHSFKSSSLAYSDSKQEQISQQMVAKKHGLRLNQNEAAQINHQKQKIVISPSAQDRNLNFLKQQTKSKANLIKKQSGLNGENSEISVKSSILEAGKQVATSKSSKKVEKPTILIAVTPESSDQRRPVSEAQLIKQSSIITTALNPKLSVFENRHRLPTSSSKRESEKSDQQANQKTPKKRYNLPNSFIYVPKAFKPKKEARSEAHHILHTGNINSRRSNESDFFVEPSISSSGNTLRDQLPSNTASLEEGNSLSTKAPQKISSSSQIPSEPHKQLNSGPPLPRPATPSHRPTHLPPRPALSLSQLQPAEDLESESVRLIQTEIERIVSRLK